MTSPHHYLDEGRRQGVPTPALRRANQERTRLLGMGAHPVLSLGHVAHETGASYSYLREVVSRTRDPYRSLALAQANGKSRPISVPDPILADVQQWILKNPLGGLSEHPASYAYQQGKSTVMCAQQHAGAAWMVKMDLHDFFGTVTERMVYKIFKEAGYGSLVAFELARLSTRAEDAVRGGWREMQYVIKSYAVRGEGVLPQGAPTSGKLANAVAKGLDLKLQNFAVTEGLTYTRYSDDLFFSSPDAFDRATAVNIVHRVSQTVRAQQFRVHEKKTRILPPGSRRVVLGLLVDDTVRLLPEHRRRIEVHLRGCEKFGLAAHSRHRGFNSVFSFVNHIDGWIAYTQGVEPERAALWAERFKDVCARAKLPTS